MFRNSLYPINPTTIFHGDGRIKAFCDGFGDDGQLIGFQLLDHFLLAGNDGINLAALAVEIIGYVALQTILGEWKREVAKIILV